MINHQQFCVIIGNVHAAECVGWREGGGRGWGGCCRGRKKINHIILLWPCFIDLCWCSHISYLICIYWRAFRTMWAIWAMRENRAALPSPKLRAYGLEWRPRGGKKKRKKSAGYLDAPAAYITRKYSRSPGRELRPQSGHRRVLADWIDLMHMVIRSVCSRAGVQRLAGNLPMPPADSGKEESGVSFSKH